MLTSLLISCATHTTTFRIDQREIYLSSLDVQGKEEMFQRLKTKLELGEEVQPNWLTFVLHAPRGTTECSEFECAGENLDGTLEMKVAFSEGSPIGYKVYDQVTIKNVRLKYFPGMIAQTAAQALIDFQGEEIPLSFESTFALKKCKSL